MLSIRLTLFIGFDINFFSQIYLIFFLKESLKITALIKNVVGGSGFQSIKHVYYSYQLFNLFHLRFPSKKIT